MRSFAVLLLAALPAVAVAQAPPCTPVPIEFFSRPQNLFAKGLPAGTRLASDRKTLGLLVPRLPDGHELFLVRGEEIVSELWLPVPKQRSFLRAPMFYLSDDGDVAILRSADFAAVYAGGSLTAVIEDEHIRGANVAVAGGQLYWAPNPTAQEMATVFKQVRATKPESEDWPALLMRSELDGSDHEVLLRLEEQQLGDGDRVALYHTLSPAARPDRKLWLVGNFSGEVMLTSGSGHVERRFQLPGALKRPEDEPEARAKADEELQRDARKDVERLHTDATKPPPKRVEIVTLNRSRLFHGIWARGRDLVVRLATSDPPEGSILVIDDAGESARCFTFPGMLRGNDEAALQVAVTDDAIWFRKPFGFITWDSLDALSEPKRKPTRPVPARP